MGKLLTDDWPVSRPANWVHLVNQPQSAKELAALRTSVERGRPYGEERWQLRTAKRLELESSLRPPGRPRNVE